MLVVHHLSPLVRLITHFKDDVPPIGYVIVCDNRVAQSIPMDS